MLRQLRFQTGDVGCRGDRFVVSFRVASCQEKRERGSDDAAFHAFAMSWRAAISKNWSGYRRFGNAARAAVPKLDSRPSPHFHGAAASASNRWALECMRSAHGVLGVYGVGPFSSARGGMTETSGYEPRAFRIGIDHQAVLVRADGAESPVTITNVSQKAASA